MSGLQLPPGYRERLTAQHRAFVVAVSDIGQALAGLASRDRERAALRLYAEADEHQARSQDPEDRHAARARYLRQWGDRAVVGADEHKGDAAA